MSSNPVISDTIPSPAAHRAQPPAEYLTRRQAAEFIRDVLGRPFSFSTATKLAALGEFAPPATWWGRRPLYSREGLRIWTEARSRPSRSEPPPSPVTASAQPAPFASVPSAPATKAAAAPTPPPPRKRGRGDRQGRDARLQRTPPRAT